MSPPLTFALLIISDTASQTPTSDLTTPLLTKTLLDNNWALHTNSNSHPSIIVPDDIPRIQEVIVGLCGGDHDDDGDNMDDAGSSGAGAGAGAGKYKRVRREGVNLLLTSGGTGFGVRDVTPEAVGPLLGKRAEGIVHGMLAASLLVTPFAILSRPIAGIRNKTLIITLPGSPKAAQENLLAIIKQVPHACLQAAGADSRTLHAGGMHKLERDAGFGASKEEEEEEEEKHHHHNHEHHSHASCGHVVPRAHTADRDLRSNDPRSGPARRHRESPYPMVSVDEALRLVLEEAARYGRKVKAVVGPSLVGHVLGEDVVAGEAVPAYRASIVDGYAITVPESGPSPVGTFKVAGVSHAAPGEISALRAGQVARITTGAPLPPNATSVVMVEDTVLKSVENNEEKEIEIFTDKIKMNENVREIGSDVQIGEIILKEGDEITAVGGELGLLASVGKAEVLVNQKPIVGVLSTGNEIVEHDRPGGLRIGEVRDCNRPTVIAAVQGWGFEVLDLGIAKDKPGALKSSLQTGMQQANIIITTGGVSMGELDLLKPTIERALGGTIHFGRVAMKPGKPSTFATIPFLKAPHSTPDTCMIFSLPGNPASALVALHLLVLPSLHQWCGIRHPGLPRALVSLDHNVVLDPGRPEFHRAVVGAGRDGLLHAVSTGGQRSSRVGSLRSANALLCLPASEGGLRRGEMVQALLMGKVGGL